MIVLQHRSEGNAQGEKDHAGRAAQDPLAVLRDKLVWTLLPVSQERAWERVCERYLV